MQEWSKMGCFFPCVLLFSEHKLLTTARGDLHQFCFLEKMLVRKIYFIQLHSIVFPAAYRSYGGLFSCWKWEKRYVYVRLEQKKVTNKSARSRRLVAIFLGDPSHHIVHVIFCKICNIRDIVFAQFMGLECPTAPLGCIKSLADSPANKGEERKVV